MSYQVIARKYRPQLFDEVVGQRLITDTLKNAIVHNRVRKSKKLFAFTSHPKTSQRLLLLLVPRRQMSFVAPSLQNARFADGHMSLLPGHHRPCARANQRPF